MKKIFIYSLLCLLLNDISYRLHAQELIRNNKTSAIVATVNGKPITLFDVLAETAPQEQKFSLMYSGEKLKDAISNGRKNAIDNIIARMLISAIFRKNKYVVPNQIIEKMLDSIAADMAGGDRKLLEAKTRQSGVSINELKKYAYNRAATMMLINARCYNHVEITPHEIYQYYEKNKDNYALPRKINLQILYLKSLEDDGSGNIAHFALKLRPEIINADEKLFAKFVKTYSVGPQKEYGGNLGWINMNQLRPEFKKAIESKLVGNIVGPVKTPEGFYFIRIKKIEAPRKKSFKDVKKNIKKHLEDKVKEKNYKKYISEIRKTAIINYYNNNEDEISK